MTWRRQHAFFSSNYYLDQYRRRTGKEGIKPELIAIFVVVKF